VVRERTKTKMSSSKGLRATREVIAEGFGTVARSRRKKGRPNQGETGQTRGRSGLGLGLEADRRRAWCRSRQSRLWFRVEGLQGKRDLRSRGGVDRTWQ